MEKSAMVFPPYVRIEDEDKDRQDTQRGVVSAGLCGVFVIPLDFGGHGLAGRQSTIVAMVAMMSK
jgi:hypothetical protein